MEKSFITSGPGLNFTGYYKCAVALPHGAVGWSAVCDLWYFLIILTYFSILLTVKIRQKFTNECTCLGHEVHSTFSE